MMLRLTALIAKAIKISRTSRRQAQESKQKNPRQIPGEKLGEQPWFEKNAQSNQDKSEKAAPTLSKSNKFKKNFVDIITSFDPSKDN